MKLLAEKKKAEREQAGWRSAHLRKGTDRRLYRLKRKGRAFIGEVYTPTGWRWVGELKPTTVKQSFVWDEPEPTNPLNVLSPGIPPTLRPEEIVEASADILELHTFIEKLINVMDGSAAPSYASPLQKALRRCIRLRMLMQVADARLKASKAA